MQPEAMVTTLKSLKLFGMAQAIDELPPRVRPPTSMRSRSWKACLRLSWPNGKCDL